MDADNKKNNIFISYRRKNGGEWVAYILYLRFYSEGYSVFFDKESLRGGRYEERIYKAIEECEDVILVLPPEALNPRKKKDVFIDEIVYAYKFDKNIIPIMIYDFQMPDVEIYKSVGKEEVYTKYISQIPQYNGCKLTGIMNLEGVYEHLKSKLLRSKSNNRVIHLCDRRILEKQRYDHYIVGEISSPEYFVENSRDKEISWLQNAIECMQPVYIWGFGGVGKTEIAYEFARREAARRNVFFVRFDKSIRNTIINMKFTNYDAGDLEKLSYENEEVIEESIYQRKLAVLYTYSADDVLIIDNFDVAGRSIDELRRERSYHELLGAQLHIIFTTRNQPDLITPEVTSLEDNDLLRLMHRYVDISGMRYSDDNLKRIIQVVGNHTYMVELIAKQFADPFNNISIEEMTDKFIFKGIKNIEELCVASDKDRSYVERSLYEHMKVLFEIDKMDSIEKTILMHACILPEAGMLLSIFIKGAEQIFIVEGTMVDYKKALKGLVRKSFLHIRNNKILTIHPLIRYIVWQEIVEEKSMLEYIGSYLNVCYALREDTFQTKIYTVEEYKDFAFQIGMMYEQAYEVFDHKYATLAASAITAYYEEERRIILTNQLLDEMIQRKQRGKVIVEDEVAYVQLLGIWCPNLSEAIWNVEQDESAPYGNELLDNHTQKPQNIRNIYMKLKTYLEL